MRQLPFLLSVLLVLGGCNQAKEGHQSASSEASGTVISSRQTSSQPKQKTVLDKLLAWDGYDESIKTLEVSKGDIASLDKIARDGDAEACFVLARLYRRGYHIAQDDAKCVEFLKKSVNLNHTKAHNCLAFMYKNGLGIKKDIAESNRLYRIVLTKYTKLAEQGDAAAQYQVGDIYYFGTGVSKDEQAAVEWYRKAAEQGYAQAQCNLGVRYECGTGVSKDEQAAVKWYRKAAEQGYAQAQCNLGFCYDNGTGVSKDKQAAVEWYRKAAEQGHARAQCDLGFCYYNGTGVSKDKQAAVEWYRKAAEQGYAQAQYNLGVCFHTGTGVSKNVRTAIVWYQKAIEQGYEGVENNLGIAMETISEQKKKFAVLGFKNIDDVSSDEWLALSSLSSIYEAKHKLRSAEDQIKGFNMSLYSLGPTNAEDRRDLANHLTDLRMAADEAQRQFSLCRREQAKRAIEFARKSSRSGFLNRVHKKAEDLTGLKFQKSIAALPKAVQLPEIQNSIGMKFKQIPAGSFIHAENEKESTATVTTPFYLGVYEVTQVQFEQVMGFNPSGFGKRQIVSKLSEFPRFGDQLPVNGISVNEAMEFCWKLSNLESEKEAGRVYRLPSEHEWELASRAGCSTPFPFGDSGDFIPKLANLRIEGPEVVCAPVEVGTFAPNRFGIFDMIGNVTEPCADRFDDWRSDEADYLCSNSKKDAYIIRGGDYSTASTDTNCSQRGYARNSRVASSKMGIRVVCVTEPVSDLSKNILEAQSEKCDPVKIKERERQSQLKLRQSQLKWREDEVAKASKKLEASEQSDLEKYFGYSDRAEAYIALGKISDSPEESFKNASNDLDESWKYEKLIDQQNLSQNSQNLYEQRYFRLNKKAGAHYLKMGNSELAAKCWEKAIRVGDKLHEYHVKGNYKPPAVQLDIVKLLEKLGRFNEAIERLDREIKYVQRTRDSSYKFRTWLEPMFYFRGRMKQRVNDHQGATRDFKSTLRAKSVWFKNAVKSLNEGYDGSIVGFEEIMKDLATAYEQNGDKDSALKQRKAIGQLRKGKLVIID